MSRNRSLDISKSSEISSIRPTHVTVDLAQLKKNYQAIQQKVGDRQVMAVLKANAYGHGLVETGRYFEQIGIPYFSVAYLEEAIELREAGIQTPILVFGGLVQEQIAAYLQYQLTITAPSIEKLEQINQKAGEMGVTAKVHLIFDTGMERLGVHYYNARDLIQASLTCENCSIEGIYTHFANADTADLSYSLAQLDRFKKILSIYAEINREPPPLRHMANSGGTLQLEESWFDMVRPGILMYGVYPSAASEKTIAVKPALRWTSRVVYFKVVEPGHPVSYGSTWQSDTPVRVVTLPVGYGDGYFRALSNQARVLIRGQEFPVIGRVCMDQTMINIGDQSAWNGDEVTLLGADEHGNVIPVEDLAEWSGTIPYEVLTSISRRVPRVYKNSLNSNGQVD
ncbi:MAG: alanine racemase [Anaerolineae bacterium]